MYCTNCGKDLKGEEMTCPNCGVPVVAGDQAEYPRTLPTKPTKARAYWRALSVFALLVLGIPSCLGGGCLVVLLVGSSPKSFGKSYDFWVALSIAVLLLALFSGLIYFDVWTRRKK